MMCVLCSTWMRVITPINYERQIETHLGNYWELETQGLRRDVAGKLG